MRNQMHSFKDRERKFIKRVFPRYPFSFLVFKASGMAFQIKDISFRGMQISLKDGEHDLSVGDVLKGELHWKGEVLEIHFRVKWVNKDSVGGGFERDGEFDEKIQSFFCAENIISGLRPLHLQKDGPDLPDNLKYWFKSDGSVEFFVWCRNGGEIYSFQGIVLDKFFEWEEGKGVWMGNILKYRDWETPLECKEEFFLEEDTGSDSFMVELFHKIFSQLPGDYLSEDDRKFLLTLWR